MGLTQALFVILGSAVGTTITAWITSIPTVEILTVIMALGGTICIMFLKGDKNKEKRRHHKANGKEYKYLMGKLLHPFVFFSQHNTPFPMLF